jgi:hypothetical protein
VLLGDKEMNEEERQKENERLVERFERQKKANLANREIYKWFLEFFRNCMVVAALFFLANKSGSWWLYVIALLAGFFLAAYCYTYVENLWPAIDLTDKRGWWRRLSILGSVVALQLILTAITAGLYFTVNKIVEVQGVTQGRAPASSDVEPSVSSPKSN